jgi:hypothetical protein
MKKLNKRLKINHLYWDINSLSKDEMPENCVGQCSPPFEAQINILEQGGMEDVDTLLHEIIHAIDFGVSAKLSERQTELLANGLTFVLRDNPWLFNYVKQKIKEEYVR